MTSVFSYRYRIEPNKTQAGLLSEMLADFCELYNAALEHRVRAYEKGVSVTRFDQQAELPEIRRDLCHIGRWSATAEQHVIQKLDRTFKAFFRRCKRGDVPGFPRFKSSRHYHAADFRVGDGLRLTKTGKLALLGVPGEIKVRWHRAWPSKPKSAVLSRKAGKWYLLLRFDVAVAVESSGTKMVGIDLGLSNFAVLSDGAFVKRQRITKRNARKLRRLQRAMSRAMRGSKMYEKRRSSVAKHHFYIANFRRDFLHKESRKLVNKFGRIAFEDLSIKGLAAGMLAKEIHDASWAQFILMVSYKAANAGGEVVLVDPRGTSQTCPECGVIAKKTIKQRLHNCPCGCLLDRDVAAAMIVYQRAFGRPPGMGGGSLIKQAAA